VTLVLRLIRQSRWDSPGKYDWLAEEDIPADPLADFANTSENSLSVWFLDDERKNLNDILAAVAAGRDKADKLDYVIFCEELLKIGEIEVCESVGRTPDAQANGHHRDLAHLSAAKVLALTTMVWRANLGRCRIDERKTVQLVAEAVRRGRISLDHLRPKLRDDVQTCLGSKSDERQKPR
jgi:hypothetical protein